MIIRVNKSKDYTVMGNCHLRERGMSLKAKGLMSLMLSLPDDWDFSVEGLKELSSDGKDGVACAVRELERNGYLVRSKRVSESGKFDGYVYDLYEQPLTEKPLTEKPLTENPSQLNTNILNTNIQKKENILKERVPDEKIEEWFSAIYSMYPRKEARVNAKQAFIKKIRGLDEEQARLVAGRIYRMLQAQLMIWSGENEGRGRKREYTPLFASWINANCEDNDKKGKKI